MNRQQQQQKNNMYGGHFGCIHITWSQNVTNALAIDIDIINTKMNT